MSQGPLTKCRVCKCSELQPCCPPCGWERGEDDLCTTCAEVIRRVRGWLIDAHRPSFAALRRESHALVRTIEAAKFRRER